MVLAKINNLFKFQDFINYHRFVKLGFNEKKKKKNKKISKKNKKISKKNKKISKMNKKIK